MCSFVERKKDTLKVGGAQVSPTEIEDVIRIHPSKLVADVCVGGVSGGRTSDEKNPRAWIVLSEQGKRLGGAETIKALDEWTRKNLSSYKWVRGGFEIVDEVSFRSHLSIMTLPPHAKLRFRRIQRGKFCDVYSRSAMRTSVRRLPSCKIFFLRP